MINTHGINVLNANKVSIKLMVMLKNIMIGNASVVS